MIKSNLIIKIFVLVVAFLFSIVAFGQINGDYQTRATGNWNANSTWQVYNGGSWVNCVAGDYPGAIASTATVYITGNFTVSITANVPNSIGALIFVGAAATNIVQFSGAFNLDVAGQITINPPTTNGNNNGIFVNTGFVTCTSVTSSNSGNNGRDCKVGIGAGGILTVNGNIAMGNDANRNDITFTGAGTLNVTGNLTTGQLTCVAGSTINIGGTLTPAAFTVSTSTVNFNGSDQTIPTYTYNNLSASGSGLKSLPNGDLSVNGNLSVSNSTLVFTAAAARILTVGGDLSGNGTIDMSPGNRTHTLRLGGASNSIGTLTTSSAASTVNFNRAGDQTVFANSNYRNLTISGSGVKTLAGNATIAENLNISAAAATLNLGTVASAVNVTGTLTASGGFNFGTTTDKTVTVSNNFTLAATGLVNMSGSTNHKLYLRGGTNTYTAGGVFTGGADNQTVYYDADLAQVVMGINYNNLVISNSNASSVNPRIKTLAAASAISGNLSVDGVSGAQTTFAIGNYIVSVGNNFSVNNYGTTTLGNQNFTVTGQTTINPFASLTDGGGGQTYSLVL